MTKVTMCNLLLVLFCSMRMTLKRYQQKLHVQSVQISPVKITISVWFINVFKLTLYPKTCRRCLQEFCFGKTTTYNECVQKCTAPCIEYSATVLHNSLNCQNLPAKFFFAFVVAILHLLDVAICNDI